MAVISSYNPLFAMIMEAVRGKVLLDGIPLLIRYVLFVQSLMLITLQQCQLKIPHLYINILIH